MKGRCTRGDKCVFPHVSEDEMDDYIRDYNKEKEMKDQEEPVEAEADAAEAPVKERTIKTSICMFHIRGKCRLGSNCKNLHMDDEDKSKLIAEVTKDYKERKWIERRDEADERESTGSVIKKEKGTEKDQLLKERKVNGTTQDIGKEVIRKDGRMNETGRRTKMSGRKVEMSMKQKRGRSPASPQSTHLPENRPRSSTSCLLYTSPSPRDKRQSRMPSSA